MPFTLSHPVAVLPFIRRWSRHFSVTGLVVGSMSSDFEYFFKLEAYPTLSEHWLGAIFFSLPLAIIASITYQLFVKDSLIKHLPQPFDSKYSGYLQHSFLNSFTRNPLKLVGSCILGLGTHLFLDWLSHPKTVFARQNLSGVSPEARAVLDYADHGFSLIALALVIRVLLRINYPNLNFTVLKKGKKQRYWLSVAIIMGGLILFHLLTPQSFPAIEEMVTLGISSLGLGLLATSIIFKSSPENRKHPVADNDH